MRKRVPAIGKTDKLNYTIDVRKKKKKKITASICWMVFNVGNKKNFSLNLNELEVEEFLFDFLKALIGFIGIRNQH